MANKENLKAKKYFQEKIKNRKTSITTKELSELKIDTSVKPQEFGNIILKKDLFGDWNISVKNDKHDLDGNSIAENKKLLQRIKALWEIGKKEIKFQDLKDLNIWTPASELKIGNFSLSSFSTSDLLSSNTYEISLTDKNKSIDGLWLDKFISSETILNVFHDFEISHKELISLSEVRLNKMLEDHFKKYFETVRKGGTSNKGLIDLVLGDNYYAIELKLAREAMKSSQADRAIGQMERYMKQFRSNFTIVIAGTLEEKKDRNLQDIIRKVKDCKGYSYYLEVR